MTVAVSDTRFLLASWISAMNEELYIARIEKGEEIKIRDSHEALTIELGSSLLGIETLMASAHYEKSNNPLENDMLAKLRELGNDQDHPFWDAFGSVDRGWFVPVKSPSSYLVALSNGRGVPPTTEFIQAGLFQAFDLESQPHDLTDVEADILRSDRWEISQEYCDELNALEIRVRENPYVMLPALLGESQPTPSPALVLFYAAASTLVEGVESSFEFGMGTGYQSTLYSRLHPGARMMGTEIKEKLRDYMWWLLDQDEVELEDIKDRTEVFDTDSLFYFRERGPFDFISFAFTIPHDVDLQRIAEQSLREGGLLIAPQQYEADDGLTEPHHGMFRLLRKSGGVIEQADVLDCFFTPAVDYQGPY
ncbi:hypothetical protein CMO91_04395 [Candidatus Woesearchaeota archaeon]|nr:hypothetical protein [Candidatus Woesearchaeota archaeon]